MKNVAIIGGGASGIINAITLNKYFKGHIQITIFEKNPRIGKKIIASGNGKCNLTNKEKLQDYVYNNQFAKKIYQKLPPNKLCDYLLEMGLFTKTDQMMRVYPLTESSKTVLDMMLLNLNQKNIHIYTNTFVEEITQANNQYIVKANNQEYQFDDVVICIGSIASTKTLENHYQLFKNMNIKITKILPGLVGLKTSKSQIKGLNGIRHKAKVTLYDNKQIVFEQLGEIQFKDDGISGIVIMNASSIIARTKKSLTLVVDLLPTYQKEELKTIYQNLNFKLPLKQLLYGLLPKQIVELICSMIVDLTIDNFIEIAKNYQIDIIGNYGFPNAQVAIGGYSVDQINEDLELKAYPNMYICGEALDVDGLCGGYNLQFAFASGYVVANAIYRKESYE